MSAKGRPRNSASIPRTLSQTIYNYLKDAIIGNDLKANQRILEKDIAARFAVSTTPVREAILRLGAEGYISIDSHRKAVVREISIQELTNIYAVLSTLDTFSAGLVIGHVSEKIFTRLESLTEGMARAARHNDSQRFLEINGEIHEVIWGELPNKVLRRSLLDVHGQLMRYAHARVRAYRDPDVMAASLQEHRDILAALHESDRRRLKRIIRLNWRVLPSRLHPGSDTEATAAKQ